MYEQNITIITLSIGVVVLAGMLIYYKKKYDNIEFYIPKTPLDIV